MKVLLTRSFFKEDLDYITERLDPRVELITPLGFDEASLAAAAAEAEVFFGSFISERLINAAPKLKFIQIPWTGVDVLDYALLERHNVIVCNSHSNALAVAEHAVALMMDAAKRIAYHDRMMRSGNWNRISASFPNEVSPFSSKVTGATVGIVGFGAIGKQIAQLLQGFQCIIKGFRRSIPQNENSKLRLLHFQTLPAELGDCDFVFICVPLTSETKAMVNQSFLSAMKPGSVLINISRGEVVNEDDLYHALKAETIGFAAIDTWFNYPKKDQPECFPSIRNPFHELNNLVLSPHRAGYLQGSLPHLDDAIDNLNLFVAGKSLKNIISLKNKY